MEELMKKCEEMLRTLDKDIIRLSVADRSGTIRTIEHERLCRCQNVYSVAKAFTMTAIGILYDKGLVSMDEKITDILKDELPDGMDERWRLCTVEMALQHRIGLPGGFLDIDVYPISTFGKDFLSYMLTYPLEYTPGEGRAYTDGAFYLLGRIVAKKSGMGLDEFLWRELFFDLGVQEAAWSHCPMGYAMGATGLYMHSEDIVKLGALYLCGGVWNGKRLLSEEWCRIAPDRGYAFAWDFSHVMYSKGGMYGQDLVVYPSQGIAMAVQTFDADSDAVTAFFRYNAPQENA